ncbi:CHAD domain protein [Actinomadura rubteroloni]|uniref:CHAD domain protein n=1 Tax=Actinomadura rubteroloni TaxID=1926885 RepID=A0A2P4ULK8_9ACTN|nr:CHAD domain-containing protein [Actinomadura rubteroloni]POM25931.1 CHAD domain protein [Actinomadura rubteroloni]
MPEHLEIESKHEAGPDFALPDLSGLDGVAAVSEPVRESLRAVYYDTPDLRLAAGGITLRRRTGGHDAGWHLKLPAGPSARHEHHAPPGLGDTAPPELAGLVLARTRGLPLVPVAAIDTERTARLLLDATGAELAEVADDAVTGRADTDDTVAWREIEVELAGAGDGALLEAAGERLRAAGARDAESPSKLARVLIGRIAPSPAEVARRKARERPPTTAGDVLLAYLARLVDELLRRDPGARLGDEEDVHQMRVATRRIRSVLKTYRRLTDRTRVDPLRAELKWLAGALGDVRDLDVLRAHFDAGADFAPELVASGLATEEAAARARLGAALGTPRYFALLDALDALHLAPPLTRAARRPARPELRRAVARAWRRLERRHGALRTARTDTARDVALHELRKAAKLARYTAEAARDAGGKPARKAAKGAKRLQTVLGEHQDAVTARNRLRAAAPRDLEDAFRLGVLYAREDARAAEARRRFTKKWKKRPRLA